MQISTFLRHWRGIERSTAHSFLSVCLSVCLSALQKKNGYRHQTRQTYSSIVYGKTSACTDPKFKRSKVKVKRLLHRLHWLYGVKSTSQQSLAEKADGRSTCIDLALWRHHIIGCQLALPAWDMHIDSTANDSRCIYNWCESPSVKRYVLKPLLE